MNILLIGLGATGTLVLKQLSSQTEHSVWAVESHRDQLFRGVAYAQKFNRCPLNVQAKSMAMIGESDLDFVQWLQRKRHPYGADDFVPRSIYGDYLEEWGLQVVNSMGSRFNLVVSTVSDLKPTKSGVYAVIDGLTHVFDCVILATGNQQPARLPGVAKTVPGYFQSSWDIDWNTFPQNGKVVVVGSGLSAIDVLIEANGRGFKGEFLVVSRHGRWPTTFSIAPISHDLEWPEDRSLNSIMRWFAVNYKLGVPVESMVHLLRTHFQMLWKGWTYAEQDFFLKRLKHRWDALRHRIPPESASLLKWYKATKRLRVIPGEIDDVEYHQGQLRVLIKRKNGTLAVQTAFAMVNATGPAVKPSGAWLRWLEQGWLTWHPNGLGPQLHGLHPVSKQGEVHQRIFVVGPPQRAELWETTAIREIKVQVEQAMDNLAALNEVGIEPKHGTRKDIF